MGDCTQAIANTLAQRGLEVSVLTSSLPTGRPDALAGASDSRPSVFRSVARWDWAHLSLVRHALSVTRADILHIQYQTGAFGMHPMINFAPRLLSLYPFAPRPRGNGGWGARSVVTFHDLLPAYLFPLAGPVRDRVTFQFARSCDAAIATNAEDADRLAAERVRDLSIIPIGSNIDPTPPADCDRAALRAQLGVGADETLLTYFGFLNHSKGGETLIRALAQIPGARLLLLGGQTGASDPTNVAYLERVRALIEELGLASRVIWTDFLPAPQVTAHLLAADAIVLPYRDGASYRRGTLMAALAHGVPTISTTPASAASARLASLPELRDGANVLLVPPDDPAAIANAVARLRADASLRAQLSQGALETARYFSWDHIADEHVKLYERLLD